MNRIKELLEEFNLLQKDMESLVGINRDIVTNLIQERKRLEQKMIIELSLFFNVSSDYLIGLTDHGIYVNVLDKVYSISKEQLVHYRKLNLIEYKDYKRILKVVSLDEIEIVNCNTQLVKFKNSDIYYPGELILDSFFNESPFLIEMKMVVNM